MIEILFFLNGNTAALDDGQIPELQVSWLLLYAEFLESKGVDPTTVKYKLPNGEFARVFRWRNGDETGLNWEFDADRSTR